MGVLREVSQTAQVTADSLFTATVVTTVVPCNLNVLNLLVSSFLTSNCCR